MFSLVKGPNVIIVFFNVFFPRNVKVSRDFCVYDTFNPFSFDFKGLNIIFYKNSCSFSS